MIRSRTWLVPGNPMWRARRVRHEGRTVAIRARHRLLPWWTITVHTRDLRGGAEAIARYLDSCHVGFVVHDNRRRVNSSLSGERARQAS